MWLPRAGDPLSCGSIQALKTTIQGVFIMLAKANFRGMAGWAGGVLVAAVLSAVIMIGCEKEGASTAPQANAQAAVAAPAAAPPKVAVVDLDAVAKAIGADSVINRYIQDAVEVINEQLINAAVQMRDQLQEEQEKLTEESAQEDRVRLARMVQAANQQVRTNKLIAQNRIQQVRGAVILNFRNGIRGHAARVASDNGASVLLLPSESLLWADTSVDITGKLIDHLRSQNVQVQIQRPQAMPAEDGSGEAPAE